MEHFDNLVCSGARSLADFLASPPEYLKGIDAKEVKENWQRHVHQIIDNLKKYKHPSDFRWGLAEWGTRSDSYDYFELPGGCGFLTAWNHPEKAIKALSEIFPNEVIEVLFADEDLGQNLGHYSIKKGKITHLMDVENTDFDECEEFAKAVWETQSLYDFDDDFAV